jgi:hypothetical protein
MMRRAKGPTIGKLTTRKGSGNGMDHRDFKQFPRP